VNSAVLVERFYGIRRTRRKVAARGRKQRADRHLIPPNDQDEQPFHALVLRVRATTQRCEFVAEAVVRCAIRGWKREHHHRAANCHEQPFRPNDFAKASLDSVSIHRRVRMSGNNDPDTMRCRRGGTKLERGAASPLSFRSNCREVRATRQTRRARTAKPATLRRTSTAASLSGAYAPSCGAGSVPPAPTSLTYASGTRACGFFSCFAGCKSAFPSLLLAVQKSV